ncbi:hypothetical protein G6F68_013239 [Rhizopus microsporus]|nr:hypothetical protein G6F68_013239 [Rhizopus microsporus]
MAISRPISGTAFHGLATAAAAHHQGGGGQALVHEVFGAGLGRTKAAPALQRGPHQQGDHQAAGDRQPAAADEGGNAEADGEVLHHMADAIAQVIGERPCPREQEHAAIPGPGMAGEAVPGLGPHHQGQQARGDDEGTNRQKDASGSMQDRVGVVWSPFAGLVVSAGRHAAALAQC